MLLRVNLDQTLTLTAESRKVEIPIQREYIQIRPILEGRDMVHYVKWEPFRDLMAMQDRMTRLFDGTFSRIFKEEAPRGAWSPLVDIVEQEKEVILRADLPEMNQSEIEIKVEENTLIIRGERKFVKEVPGENYIQIERPYGNFQRTFALPKMIDQEGIKASYKDGVLRIVLPRKKDVHPKQISVEAS